VFVTGFPAGPFGTNCFVLAPQPNSECLIIDPGMGAVDPVREVLQQNRLKPIAVLLTHGHLDHTWSVVPIADGYEIPAFIHPDDASRLTDPEATLGPDMKQLIRQMTPDGRVDVEPSDLQTLTDGVTVDLAGLTLRVAHAPGHTAGSIMFERDESSDTPALLFSGDVLFEGSIGRTDLPGGDHAAMLRSLRDVILPMDDDTVVLPGHGGQTTIGRERVTNPFLREVMTDSLGQPPRKGL
jgi:hydroxyacylglutathione hydrolase